MWVLRLYVDGQAPQTRTIEQLLKEICSHYLPDRFSLETIDLRKQPDLGQSDRILALPTLVRKLPTPIRKVIGDLTDADQLRRALNLPISKLAA